ncbi:MAG: hypothetical protein QM571_05530 [Micrococcaceae bacterium]
MALGRSLRKVLIIDSCEPCNKQTPHSHNFITQDGKKPDDIVAAAKEQVLKYQIVEFIEDYVIDSEKLDDGFAITTKAGKSFSGKRLIFATTMPDLPGYALGVVLWQPRQIKW